MPAPTLAQGGPPSSLPPQAQAEIHLPDRFDTTRIPLRDMPDTESPAVARGGRDFEPGRPFPVDHQNPSFQDPLADRSVGFSSANALPRVFTGGTPVDPSRRVAPPDTTGDLGLAHYVQWVNLRYAIYSVARSGGTITGFTLVNGFPKNGNAIWQGFGFETVVFLAALQSIPKDLYEAAQLDGAGPWQRFRHVTLPALRPVLFFVFCVGIIGSFQVFDLPYSLMNAKPNPGPEYSTLVYYLFAKFRDLRLGPASAIAYVLFLILLGISLIQWRFSNKKE